MTILRSFSFRMTLSYIAIFMGSAIILFAAYYAYSIHFPLATLKREIPREMAALEQIYAVEGGDALSAALARRAALPDKYGALHAFVARDGAVITANIPSWPKIASPDWTRLEADVFVNGVEYDRMGLMWDKRFADGSRLLLGRDIDRIDEIEENLQEGILWLGATSVLLGLVGSLLLSGAIQRRIRHISDAANQVMQGQLSERIATNASNDEFDRLGQTLNAMLDRIDMLFGTVRRVSDNVAHELRTPLARMLAQAETLEASADPVHQPEAAAIAEEARRLQRIFDGLLRISRLESGRHALALKPVKLLDLCTDVADYYAPAVEESGGEIDVVAASNVSIMADADLLFQAVANLTDNALKYGGARPKISLTIRESGGTAVIEVSDSGPGPDAADLDRLGERFYRGRNAAGLPGEGLGLALVNIVATVHGGRFDLSRAGEVTVASLTLPAGGGASR